MDTTAKQKIEQLISCALRDANEVIITDPSEHTSSLFPTDECIAKTKELCHMVYDTHHIIPRSIAPSIESGLMVAYELESIHTKPGEWVAYIEVYNDLDICCLINNNIKRQIVDSSILQSEFIVDIVKHLEKYHCLLREKTSVKENDNTPPFTITNDLIIENPKIVIPKNWEKFTPDFDYEKKPYIVKQNNEYMMCWPNAGRMNALDGTGRSIDPGEDVEVVIVDHDEWYVHTKLYILITEHEDTIDLEFIENEHMSNLSFSMLVVDKKEDLEELADRLYDLHMARLTSDAFILHNLPIDAATPPIKKQKPPKPVIPCMFPLCDKMSTPGKLYCCGDHCREHDKLLKNNRKAKSIHQ